VITLVGHVEDPGSNVPDVARLVLRMLIEALRFLSERIDLLDREIARRARADGEVRRLMSIPGVGPITATALAALAPPADAFRKGRDFAAWVGLTPSQHSTGGKQKLGTTSKMGERTLRRLLIIGASSVVRKAVRRALPQGPGSSGCWLASPECSSSWRSRTKWPVSRGRAG
jgi:transposase